jgi:serralysin
VILDFTRHVDRIDLSGINAKLVANGHRPFEFIGEGPIGRTGELAYLDFGRYLLIQGDRNGDGTADFAIKVFGTDKLTEGDFIL